MTTILIALILLAVAMFMQAYHNHLTNEVIKDIKIDIKQLYSTIETIRDIEKTSVNIDKIVKDRLNNISDTLDLYSDTLDLYKKLVDSLNDGQAQLNFRVQQLEADRTRLNNLEWHVTNLNALHKVEVYPTSTDKYDPLNPSGIMYDTNTHVECYAEDSVITDKPETINFTEE